MATMSAVPRPGYTALMSAPASRSNLTPVTSPTRAARTSGGSSVSPRISGGTPFPNSASSTSVTPCAAAYPKAVVPSLLARLATAPAFNKGAITVAAWYFAATINGVSPYGVGSSARAPALKSASTAPASSRLAAIATAGQLSYNSPGRVGSTPVSTRTIATFKLPVAPASRRSRATSACPVFPATSNTVQPSAFASLNDAWAARSRAACCVRPTRAA